MVIPKPRAGYSRVTHPFAARVPRRAFPLDLHVLSTPPAFVLSQDQTLQQKPLDNLTRQQKNLSPKHTQTRQKRIQTQKIPWHWLNKHPVEFSNNHHTPRTTRTLCEPLPGATRLHYLAWFVVSNPAFALFVPFPGARNRLGRPS